MTRVSLERRPVIAALLVLALLVGVALVLYLPALSAYRVGFLNDDASYVIQAQTLARGGNVLVSPVGPAPGPAGYLPGESILLAPVAWLLPGNTRAMQWMGVVFYLAGIVLFACLALPHLGHAGSLLLLLTGVVAPAGVLHSSTVMSDVPFVFFVAAVLLWGERVTEQRPAWAAGAGFLAGASVLVRAPGILLVVALLIPLARGKKWRHVAAACIGVALALAPWLLLRQGGPGYAGDALSYWTDPVRAVAHLRSWCSLFPGLLARSFMGLPEGWSASLPVGTILGWTLLAGAVAGWVRLARKSGLTPPLLFAAMYLAMFVAWPYFEPRFYLPLWPMLVMLAATALRPAPRTAALALLVCCQLFGTSRALAEIEAAAPMGAARWQSYDWIRAHAPPEAVIQAVATCRTYLWTNRHAVAPRPSPTMEMVILSACRDGAGFILCEPSGEISDHLEGPSIVLLPPRLDLWLDASTLVHRDQASPWDRVYRVQVDPTRCLRACEGYVDAVRAERLDPRAARASLDEALGLVPDLPNARVLRATLLLRDEPRSNAALAELRAVALQYPVCTQAVLQWAEALASRGEAGAATDILTQARARATAEERAGDAAAYDRALSGLASHPVGSSARP